MFCQCRSIPSAGQGAGNLARCVRTPGAKFSCCNTCWYARLISLSGTPYPPVLWDPGLLLFPFFLLFPRTVYTLLPRGYLERHGGKTQRAGAGASAQGEVTSEDESDSGARAAERKEGNGDEDEVEIEAALSSDADRASRWLLSSDEASDDIAFMRVSRAVLSRGVLYRIAGFRFSPTLALNVLGRVLSPYVLRFSSVFQCPFFFSTPDRLAKHAFVGMHVRNASPSILLLC